MLVNLYVRKIRFNEVVTLNLVFESTLGSNKGGLCIVICLDQYIAIFLVLSLVGVLDRTVLSSYLFLSVIVAI